MAKGIRKARLNGVPGVSMCRTFILLFAANAFCVRPQVTAVRQGTHLQDSRFRRIPQQVASGGIYRNTIGSISNFEAIAAAKTQSQPSRSGLFRKWRGNPDAEAPRSRYAFRSDKDLKQGIADFYDESTSAWERIWGDHLHHGYYAVGDSHNDHRRAQLDLIEETLKFCNQTRVPKTILDVGCGLGGSSRYLASRYGATVTGITLSPEQRDRGNAITQSKSLHQRVNIKVADALAMPFPSNSFDFIWSMESAEHIPHKQQLVNELARVVKRDGRVVVVTWCHRNLGPGESLRTDEVSVLKRICHRFFLPEWCSINDYRDAFERAGLKDIRIEDFSENIKPFWPAVMKSALTLRGILSILSRPRTIRAAFAMPLMIQGYKMGLIKFNLITARKPRFSEVIADGLEGLKRPWHATTGG